MRLKIIMAHYIILRINYTATNLKAKDSQIFGSENDQASSGGIGEFIEKFELMRLG